MNTLHAMGTIEYVNESDVPPGTTLLPIKFTYKCKFGSNGEEVCKKARACARGDLQSRDEYSETFAPTSRFNALRCLISIAAREDMKLMQFDIKGAFMISKIEDQDIYVSLPDGYGAPAGQVAKLARSLYGLRDSAFRYHRTISTWLKDYGFEALDADATMFRLTNNKDIMLLSLHVDDGLVAHNNDEMYAEFIKALSDKFELSSADSEVKWYLGISISRDYEKGLISPSQKQYIKDMLKRFKMEDTKPSPTHIEQMLGRLMYTVAWTAPECAHAVSQCARYM